MKNEDIAYFVNYFRFVPNRDYYSDLDIEEIKIRVNELKLNI